MRTKNLFKILSGFALLVLVFCLTGCPGDGEEQSFSEGLAVRSVNFYFTNVTDGLQQCVYGYCDSDGCCDTPAEQVDTFRLMSDHLYVCSFELNGEDIKKLNSGTGELAQEYFFSFSPDGGLDLIIESPEMEDRNYSDFSSKWTIGKPGIGTVNFRIGHCPENLVQGLCYEISLPVVIE
jgi:hypothetical protein